MSLAKHFFKKDEAGNNRPGFVFFLLIGVGLTGAGLWAIKGHFGSAPVPQRAPVTGTDARKSVHVDAITSAATDMGRSINVEKKSDGPKSQRGIGGTTAPESQRTEPAKAASTETTGSAVSAFDSISTASSELKKDEAEAESKDGRKRLDEGGSIHVRRENQDALSPAYVHTDQGESGNKGPARPDLNKLIYNPDAAAESKVPASLGAPVPSTPPVKRSAIYLPRGEYIEVVLLDEIETGKLSSFVQLGVVKPCYWGTPRKLVMPFGAILIGAASTGNVRDRVELSVTAVRFMRHQEMPIAGIAKDLDRGSGVRAYYIPPPTAVQMAPYVHDFMSMYLDLVAQRQRSANISVGGVGLSVNPSMSDTTRQDALLATSGAIRDFAQKQLAELEDQYAAHLVIPRGMRFYIQLTSNFDASGLYDDADTTAPIINQPMPARPVDPRAIATAAVSGGNLSARDVPGMQALQDAFAKAQQTAGGASDNGAAAQPAQNANKDASDFFPKP